jgi:hypothetical protein
MLHYWEKNGSLGSIVMGGGNKLKVEVLGKVYSAFIGVAIE